MLNTGSTFAQRVDQAWQLTPVRSEGFYLCSYQFARSKTADVYATSWDLVVIYETYRLRNVYKPSNVIANTLKLALKDAPKLLTTTLAKILALVTT